MKKCFFLIYFLFTKLVFASDVKLEFPVEKYKLPNGLTVILAPNDRVPMVSYQTWYRVGSRHEHPGVTGAAHMLEHMMFKGAKKYDNKAFHRILSQNGIMNNAFTSADYTGFFQNLPSDKLELMMDVEVDRMRYLRLNPEDLKSELQVVGEERRMRMDNQPVVLLFETLKSKIYSQHPYRWPIIGWMEDIQSYTVEALKKFYNQFYIPSNGVLVLAGKLDVPKTKKLVEKYYGPLTSQKPPQVKYPMDPQETSPQEFTMTRKVQAETILYGIKGVSIFEKEDVVLDVISAILSVGTSSRLHQRLVYREQIATVAGAAQESLHDPGVFYVYATMKPGISAARARRFIEDELKKMRTQKISTSELEKAKNFLMMGAVNQLRTLQGKAYGLAYHEILFNDHSRLFDTIEKFKEVTVEDVFRVSQKFLVPNKMSIGVLKPEGVAK